MWHIPVDWPNENNFMIQKITRSSFCLYVRHQSESEKKVGQTVEI